MVLEVKQFHIKKISPPGFPLLLFVINVEKKLQLRWHSFHFKFLKARGILKGNTMSGQGVHISTTPKLKFSKFTDVDKQIVYIGAIDPAESKSGLFLR